MSSRPYTAPNEQEVHFQVFCAHFEMDWALTATAGAKENKHGLGIFSAYIPYHTNLLQTAVPYCDKVFLSHVVRKSVCNF